MAGEVIKTETHYLKGKPVKDLPKNTDWPVYTWEEVAVHNTEQSAWIYIGNKVYDITKWLDKHPGGKTVLLLIAGRDATDLFNSYHPFNKPFATLEKFQIGLIKTTEFPQYKPDSGFYAELCSEVKKYFQDNKYDPKDPFPGLWRLAFMIVVALSSWYVAVSGNVTQNFFLRFIAAIVFGCFQALPLLHCMHDCSHTAMGHSEWGWHLIGRLTMDWMCGASLFSWYNQHVLGHHVYTNVVGADPDLPVKMEGDVRRVSTMQKWFSFYQFQHIYLLILYGVLGLKFRIQDLTDTMMAKTNGPIRVNYPQSEYFRQLCSKSFWMFWRFFIPYYYFGVGKENAVFWSLFFVSEFITGYYLAFNFQVSHVSPCADFPEIANDFNNTEWAVAQVRTTVDYAHNDWLAAFLCGALNYQTVHHLFPCVSQYHYPGIAPIVQKMCKKYGVQYNHIPTFWGAFGQHFQHLKNMGNKATAHVLSHSH